MKGELKKWIAIGAGVFMGIFMMRAGNIVGAMAAGAAVGVIVYLGLLIAEIWMEKEEAAVENEEIEGADGVSRKQLNQALDQGQKALEEFWDCRYHIKEPEVAEKISNIANVLEQLMENFKSDPKDLLKSRLFLERRIPEAVRMVRGYTRLSKTSLGKKGKEQLKEYEKSFDQLHNIFWDHLQKCLADDLQTASEDNRMMDYHEQEVEEKPPEQEQRN